MVKLWLLCACCFSLIFLLSSQKCMPWRLEQGVLFAQELQLPRVIFESDALAVIQAVNDKATGSFYGHLIQGILQICESFESCHFKHLNRRFNLVAHELAQHARRTGIYQIWKGVALPFVLSFLHYDLDS